MSDEIRVPITDYLDDKFREQRHWMAATFATKDDMAQVRTDIALIKREAADEAKADAKKFAGWAAGIGTTIGAAVVFVLGYLGIGPKE